MPDGQKLYGEVTLDALKSKAVLATDANGVVIEGTFPAEADTLQSVTTRGATTTTVSTFSTAIKTPKIYPSADSTTAVGIFKADGTTPVLNIDTTNKRLGVGTTAPFVALHSSDGATVYSGIKAYWNDASDIMVSANQPTYGAGVRIAVAHNSTVTSRPVMTFIRTRGTLETPADVQLNDNLGDLLFGGWGGTGINYGGGVFAFCDGTPSAGATPTRLSFVTGSNSGDRAERLKISADGTITVAGATTFSAATTFTANPTINASAGTASQLTFRWSTSTVRQRLGDFSVSADSLYLTSNLNFDGSNWQRDDVNKSGLAFSLDAGNGTFLGRFRYALLGANPATLSTAWQVSLGGVFQVPKLSPIADSTTAMQFFKADGTTAVMTIDTTNSRVGIGTTAPSSTLDVTGNFKLTGSADIWFGSPTGAIKVGADVNANTRSSNTRKLASFTAPDYANTRNVEFFNFDSNDSLTNKLNIGGRSGGSQYGATEVNFLTAASPSTTGGVVAMSIRSDSKIGIGTAAPANILHIISTTEQLRLGYDASNYLSATIGSTGSATFALTGTTPIFTFSQAVKGGGGFQSSDGTAGATGTQVIVTAVTQDAGTKDITVTTKTITFKNGLITSIA
jgi:hypothetical protein